jgi:hypothetical protein
MTLVFAPLKINAIEIGWLVETEYRSCLVLQLRFIGESRIYLVKFERFLRQSHDETIPYVLGFGGKKYTKELIVSDSFCNGQ